MADYNTFLQLDRPTQDEQQDDRRLILSEGGGVAVRSFYHVRDHDFSVGHNLTGAELAILMVHYRAHADLAFNFTYQQNSVVYLVRYAGIPIYTPDRSCGFFVVGVRFVEVSS